MSEPISRGQRADDVDPEALSTMENVPEDDPSFRHFHLFQGIAEELGITAMQKVHNSRREHALDYSQYTEYFSFLGSIYHSIYLGGSTFRRFISLSMFEYYGVMLLWRKIIHMKTEFNGCCRSCSSGLRIVYPNLAIPKEIGHYLEGIANAIDANGLRCCFRTPPDLDETVVGETNISGAFGRITKDNQHIYETIPSPFVLLNRIAEDVIFTMRSYVNKTASDEWRLHPLISSEDVTPSDNVLGWRRAMTLSSGQLTILEQLLEVNTTTGGWSYVPKNVIRNGGLPILRAMLQTISDQLFIARPSVHNNYEFGQRYRGSPYQDIYV